MKLAYITDKEGITYLMYTWEYNRFDVSGVLLGFEADVKNEPGRRFDNIEIDTRFCVLVNSSVNCDVSYINNILDYIYNNPDEIREFLSDVLSSEEIESFLKQIRPSVSNREIDTAKKAAIGEYDDVPKLAHNTARKRFFILNDFNHYVEVGLPTAMSIYGREDIINKCRTLDYLNGVGMNGRMIWLDGIGIQDVDRDDICGGFCR